MGGIKDSVPNVLQIDFKRCPECGHELIYPARGGMNQDECQCAAVARDQRGEVIGVIVCGCKCRQYVREKGAA